VQVKPPQLAKAFERVHRYLEHFAVDDGKCIQLMQRVEGFGGEGALEEERLVAFE